jgi:hypothetical protein
MPYSPTATYASPFHPGEKDGKLAPVMACLPENPDEKFAMAFSNMDALIREMERIEIKEYKVKEIMNMSEFLLSLQEAGYRLMIDPYIHEGKTRWTELMLEGPTKSQRKQMRFQ